MFSYKIKGTLSSPTHLFRYPRHGAPDFLGGDGVWHREPRLLAYVQDDPLGADDVTTDDARRVAALFGFGDAVPAV